MPEAITQQPDSAAQQEWHVPMLLPGSLPADSVAADTIVAGEQLEGIVLVDTSTLPRQPEPQAGEPASAMSWVYLGLALLFCVIGLRFRNSPRFIHALFSDLSDTRMRHNAFDDTVNESTLMLLLNLLWIACTGIFLWSAVNIMIPPDISEAWSLKPIADRPAAGIGICAAVAALYLAGMQLAYWVVGYVFTDRGHARLWLKGANAPTALMSLPFLVLALVILCYPQWSAIILIIAASIFILGKIVFIFKGFRIFFTRFSSWLLFLYYLCSLEIVPLVITAFLAVAACEFLL